MDTGSGDLFLGRVLRVCSELVGGQTLLLIRSVEVLYSTNWVEPQSWVIHFSR